MEQLIQPNLSAVGYPDYCLAYVEQVFGVQNDPDPMAWTGWNNTKLKHTDLPPSDVSVPVWFSWTGTIDGVTRNWGHVAVSTPQGVYTNPLSGSGHKVFPSVQALASAYGVEYVGWSEDIGNLRVIQGEEMLTRPQIARLWLLVNLKDLAESDKDTQEAVYSAYEGQPLQKLLDDLSNGDGHKAVVEQYLSAPGLEQKVDSLTSANLKLTDQITALKSTPVVQPTDPSVTVTQSGLWAAFKKILGLGG